MSQLSSSLARAARAAPSSPLAWQPRLGRNLSRPDADVCESRLRRGRWSSHAGRGGATPLAGAASFEAKAPGRTVQRFSSWGALGRAHAFGGNASSAAIPALPPHGRRRVPWRPPLGRTETSAFATLPSPSDEDADVATPPEKAGGATGAASIPFRRSGKAKSGAGEKEDGDASGFGFGFGFDDRARAKLGALATATQEAKDARAACFAAHAAGDEAPPAAAEGQPEREERWRAAELQLARAYSQAVKYTARIAKSPDATAAAERLLSEWTARFLAPFGVAPAWSEARDAGVVVDPETTYLNKKRTVRALHRIAAMGLVAPDDDVPATTPRSDGGAVPATSAVRAAASPVRIPPPSAGDYVNLLRAYSVSKARRKGQKSEVLLRNMVQMAKTVAFFYGEGDDRDLRTDAGMEDVVSPEGNSIKKWRLWVNDTVPNSKVFALAIKCHAGSTHSDSLDRVLVLNHIHDAFAGACPPSVPGVHVDDPYVLLHSIKALKNLQKKEERGKAREWLRRLQRFVTDPANAEYFGEGERESGALSQRADRATEADTAVDAAPAEEARLVVSQTIDVTSAYTTLIRLLARLRGTDGVAAEARQVLARMHEVREVTVHGLTPPEPPMAQTDGALPRKYVAYVDVRANAYNLVLGLYRDSKKAADAAKAVELLQSMVNAGEKDPEERQGVPPPTEQSFEYVISSLANMEDGEKAIQEAERLIQLMEENTDLELNAAVYNAFITVCNKQLFGKAHLYHKAMDILEIMKEKSKTNPGAAPNAETIALTMKACSLSEHEDKEKVLATASELFSQLEEQETSEKSALALTDRAYYYMLKCIDVCLVEDAEAKKDRIEELFSAACQRGLCSANVLTLFRNSVSEEDYHLTVGKGRLADHWIANITGPRALYTDGSKGGAGKHAKRKGKSTSNWMKKNRAKEVERNTRAKDKKAKQFFKKMTSGKRLTSV